LKSIQRTVNKKRKTRKRKRTGHKTEGIVIQNVSTTPQKKDERLVIQAESGQPPTRSCL